LIAVFDPEPTRRAIVDSVSLSQFNACFASVGFLRLLDLLRSGLLDIHAIRPRVYPLEALPKAKEAADGRTESGMNGDFGLPSLGRTTLQR
jgi:threonine dehydrogenase-like Zn-dependent dehydrogenase